MLSTLDRLNIGESGIVKEVHGREDIKHRLMDIGVVNNLKIDCVLVSPMGDPKAYWIKGALIALREDDAKKIFVEVI